MRIVDAIKSINPDAKFQFENDDINNIEWTEGTTPISVADIKAKISELPTWEELDAQKETLKASAKSKLIAGEPLTEEEANTLVL